LRRSVTATLTGGSSKTRRRVTPVTVAPPRLFPERSQWCGTWFGKWFTITPGSSIWARFLPGFLPEWQRRDLGGGFP